MTSVIRLNERQRTKILAFLGTCTGIYVGQAEKTIRFGKRFSGLSAVVPSES